VGQQKRTMSCSRVGKEGGRLWGGGFRGSSTCPLAADGGEKCMMMIVFIRIIYICIRDVDDSGGRDKCDRHTWGDLMMDSRRGLWRQRLEGVGMFRFDSTE